VVERRDGQREGAMRQGDDQAGPATTRGGGGPPAAGPVLVVTKLRAPTARTDLVPRRRLVDLLVRRGPHKLTLIDAPAGWGKTTLLAEWQDDPAESRPFAWVSLDKADNDPVRFWTYVLTALGTLQPGLGERALGALGGRVPSITRDVLPELINELAASAQELVLALDDYHTIGNQQIHEGLELLLERRSSTWPSPAVPTRRCRWPGCASAGSSWRSAPTPSASATRRRPRSSTTSSDSASARPT
jgi:hypothetical protein